MTRQATDNLYIELDYFTPEEYYVYEAVAESALIVESTLTCTISHIEGVDIVLTPFASLSADIARIRNVSVGAASRTPKTISVFGNAQVSTVQKKFGAGSIAFDGSGDYLTIPSNTDFAYATGTFTIEMWVYRVGGGANQVLLDQRTAAPTNYAPVVFINASNALQYNDGAASVITGATTVPLNAWSHVALSRSGTSTRLFLNGVQQGSTYTDTRNYIQTPIRIGIRFDQSTQAFNGYIDEVRITKGVARYTSNFTAPTSAFVNDTNTVLLVHGDTNISDDAGRSDLVNEFTLTGLGERIRFADATLSDALAFTATAEVVQGAVIEADASLSSEFITSSLGGKLFNNVIVFEGYVEDAYAEVGYVEDAGVVSSIVITAANLITVEAQLSVETTVVTLEQKIKNADANIFAEFTASGVSDIITAIEIFAFAEAQLAVEVARVRFYEIESSSAFDIATDFVRFRDTFADAEGVFQTDATSERSRDYVSDIQAAFSFDATIGSIKEFECNFGALFTPNININVRINNFAALDSEFALQAEILRIKDFSVDVGFYVDPNYVDNGYASEDGSRVTVTAVIGTLNEALVSANSVASLNADVNVNFDGVSVQSAEFAQTTDSKRIRFADASLLSDFNTNIQAETGIIGSANITAEFTMSVTGNAVRDAELEFESIATNLASVAYIGDFLVTLQSQFDIVANVRVITGVGAAFDMLFDVDADINYTAEQSATSSSQFNIVADINNISSGSVDVDSEFALSADNGRIRDTSANFDAIATNLTIAAKITDTLTLKAGEFTLNAIAVKNTDADAQATTEFAFASSGERVRYQSAQADSEFAVNANGRKGTEAALDAVVEFSANIVAEKNAQFSANIDSAMAFDILAVATKVGESVFELTSTLDSTAQKITDITGTFVATLEQTAVVVKTVDVDSNNSITATLESQPNIIKGVTATASSAFAQTAVVVKTVNAVANISDAAVFQSTVVAIRNNEIIAQISSQLAAVGDRRRNTNSNMSCTVTINAVAVKTVRGASTINSTTAVTANGRLIIIDKYEYIIPREIREFAIHAERREYRIVKENREHIVRG
jgi:hypothetical protein